MSYNESTLTGYFNGEEKFSASITPASNSPFSLGIGNNPAGTADTWDGPIDELRIDKAPASIDWARASYENQKPGSTFLKVENFRGTPVFNTVLTDIYARKGVAMPPFSTLANTGGTRVYSGVGRTPGRGGDRADFRKIFKIQENGPRGRGTKLIYKKENSRFRN